MIQGSISLRDPAGQLIKHDGRFIRIVGAGGVGNARSCLESKVVREWLAAGRFVSTDELAVKDWPAIPEVAGASIVLEHEPVFFPSCPAEWSPAMLRTAGLLTLELATALLKESRGLKDATPLNILFDGTRPIFIDALSVEERNPTDPVWLAYGQFVRTFILPFIASRHLGWSLRRTFTGSRDGLDPDQMFRTLGAFDLLRPRVFSFVTGPTLLSRLQTPRYVAQNVDSAKAKFVLSSLLSHLRSALEDVSGDLRRSEWTAYRDTRIHPPDYHNTRQEIVQRVLERHTPMTVLDIGTNDGAFASLAAGFGASVVAIDRDEAVIDRAFRQMSSTRERVLPLVVDLADPTPGTGWRNAERLSFLDRAGNGFDCVLCLAVLHHLVIGDWLPLSAVLQLLASLTKTVLIVEFVPADDPYCIRLAAGRPIDSGRWSIETLKAEASNHFILDTQHAVGERGRELLVLRKRGR